ncbi:hypothetical protein IGL76_003167 [Enterococcus sp. DIV2381]
MACLFHTPVVGRKKGSAVGKSFEWSSQKFFRPFFSACGRCISTLANPIAAASDRHETKQQREGEIKAHRPDIFKNLKKIPHAESYFLRKSLLVNEVPLLFSFELSLSSFELSLSSFDFLANINAFFRSDDRQSEGRYLENDKEKTSSSA